MPCIYATSGYLILVQREYLQPNDYGQADS